MKPSENQQRFQILILLMDILKISNAVQIQQTLHGKKKTTHSLIYISCHYSYIFVLVLFLKSFYLYACLVPEQDAYVTSDLVEF